jgi:toxin ParE1/3/4
VNVSICTAARQDILRQYEWYLEEQQAEAIAQRFLDAFEAGTEQLRSMPDIGAPRHSTNPQLAGLRSWPVPGFPSIRIYYIRLSDSLRIVRVLRWRRDVGPILEEDEPTLEWFCLCGAAAAPP